ncbi:T9SS type A sorting domain-containing protein [Hymenobacter volaticus]|uniref:T9SS type A sorting domain-containing protein n=1 Tax=Hymenobacter volaticus TaxID=2932254 RepID=A0ABY4GEG5_9BACT|nr:T9SS type A sorting domain-containing protein [Hymenobacter volaticus]UOQ69325.1 T9SS type A sorting domain-containing protein [Hymenobacter volaticus]
MDALGRVLVTGRSESGLGSSQQFATVAYTQASQATAKVLSATTQPTASASPASGQQLAVYPNPATGPTTIRFRPVLDGPAQVLVYNQLGQQVATLYDGPVRQGHSYELSLRSEQLPAGLYTCSLLVSGQRESVRLVVTH